MSIEDTSASAEASTDATSEVLDSIDSSLGEVSEESEEISAEAGDSSEEISAEEASTEELTDVLQDDDSTEEEVQEAAFELKRRMTFKVNGKDVERDIDLGDEAKLQELLQKGFAADERFQEASGMEKQMKDFAKMLQSDPIQALIAAGHDPDAVTEAYMQQRIDDMKKSPEQVKLEELQKEVEVERKLREELEQEKVSAEQSRVQEEYSRELDTEITDALGGSTLPKSPYVVKRIAENLMIALERDGDASVSDILPLVERQINGEIREMFEAMPEDVIEKILGNNVSTKLRKRRIKKMKKTPEGASTVQATGQSEINKVKSDKKPKSAQKASEFFRNF